METFTTDTQTPALVTVVKPNVTDQILVGAGVAIAGTLALALINAASNGISNGLAKHRTKKELKKQEATEKATEKDN